MDDRRQDKIIRYPSRGTHAAKGFAIDAIEFARRQDAMSSMPPDPALIQAAQAGDVSALNEVLACSRQDLRRYAEYHCEVNDVEDAVQETLFMASRRLRDLRSVESFTSWMFRIVKRECNRMRRGWRMVTNQEIDERIQPVATPAPLDWRMQVARMMAAMPPAFRTILLLRDIEGLALEEMAQKLDLSLPATKSRLHRARLLARELLASPGEPVDLSDFS
ncbi:MAG: RNA polymerase sigma factor [Proteobacteria bacterium]|nr:RNA polymerase sigma factor [Pseudomonadota bacterium]